MISVQVKVRKTEFCIVFARKQQKCSDRAPLKTENQRNYEKNLNAPVCEMMS